MVTTDGGAWQQGLGSATTTSLDILESHVSGVVLVVAMAVYLNEMLFLEWRVASKAALTFSFCHQHGVDFVSSHDPDGFSLVGQAQVVQYSINVNASAGLAPYVLSSPVLETARFF